MSFKKSDLLDGDIVTQRNEEQKRYSTERNGFVGLDGNSYLDYDNYTENLLDKDGDKIYDIMKVERAIEYKIIFDRNTEVKEMTIAEIEKELGYSVKIIKEKED